MPPAAEPTIQSAPSLPVIGQETVDNASGGTPAPETTSPPSINKHWTQALDEIDLPDKEPPKAPPAKAPETKAPEPEKAKPKEVAKTETKQPEKKVEPAPEKDELPPFRTNQELRKWAKDRHVAATVSEKKLAEYEAKLKELESRVPKTEQGAELVAQQIVEAKKKIESYERIIEMQAFEHSEKYRKEYADPYYQAMGKAEKEIAELLVTEPTGEQEPTGETDADGNPKMRAKMRQRPATKADFLKVYTAPRAQARQLAKAMFGDDADDVMSWRKNIAELAEKANAAIEDRRLNHAKYRQEEEAQKSAKSIAVQRLWQTANERISQDPKRIEYWGEDKEDPESNKALASGFKLADEFFSEKRDQMNDEERVEFDAYIRHSIAMGPRLAYKFKKLSAENAALKEEIAQLRGSEPGDPKPVGEEVQPREKNVMEALNELPD